MTLRGSLALSLFIHLACVISAVSFHYYVNHQFVKNSKTVSVNNGFMLNSTETSICRFLELLSLDKLKQLLERERLPKSGLKADIVKRVLERISPQRILLHTHDDDVIKFAEQCNYRDALQHDIDNDNPRDHERHQHQHQHHSLSETRSSRSKHNKRRTSYEFGHASKRSCYDISSADDLVKFRELADRCRVWILESVWSSAASHTVTECRETQVSQQIEYMEDVDDIEVCVCVCTCVSVLSVSIYSY